MELEVLIVNIAYATYAATALCQRLRTLRYVLLASSILFATFGLLAGIPSIIAWNLGLALLNGRALRAGPAQDTRCWTSPVARAADVDRPTRTLPRLIPANATITR